METRPAVLVWPGKPFDPVWVDLLAGEIRAFPRDRMVASSDGTVFTGVPVFDSPCLLAERAVIEAEVPSADNPRRRALLEAFGR